MSLDGFLGQKWGKVSDWEAGPVLDWVFGWVKVALFGVSGPDWENGRFWDKKPKLDVAPVLDVGPGFWEFGEKSGNGRNWVTG